MLVFLDYVWLMSGLCLVNVGFMRGSVYVWFVVVSSLRYIGFMFYKCFPHAAKNGAYLNFGTLLQIADLEIEIAYSTAFKHARRGERCKYVVCICYIYTYIYG